MPLETSHEARTTTQTLLTMQNKQEAPCTENLEMFHEGLVLK
jgi:hypothetical protein